MDKLERMVYTARQSVESKNWVSAEVLYKAVLKDTTPPTTGVMRVAHGEACVYFAREALKQNRPGTALDWYRQGINADMLAVDYRLEMVRKCYLPMSMMLAARMECKRCAQIEPENSDVWHLLGGIEHRIGTDPQAAIDAYERQMQLKPNDPEAMQNRATIAFDMADYDTARDLMHKILAMPDVSKNLIADSYCVLAMIAYREGRHEDAIPIYEKAIEMGCYEPSLARWNMSLAQHAIGRYREAWANHEHRGKQTVDASMAALMHRFTQPMWNNEPPPAKIHVHQEMGYGDAIAMARYLPAMVGAGYEVSLEVSDDLVGLFQLSLPGVKVMGRAPDYPGSLGIKPFDYHVPMLSLPYLFGTDIDTIPWDGPYLKAEPKLVDQYRGDLLARFPKGGPYIGLCWSSGILQDALWLKTYGQRKSMHFRELKPLQELLVSLVSLQVGPEREQIWGRVHQFLPKHPKPTWAETAALIANLDLVITVDTSVAHLAGAMGKPVWIMMHTEGSWHFMADREKTPWQHKSPWYPSATLFRQKKPYEWGPVVASIADALKAM